MTIIDSPETTEIGSGQTDPGAAVVADDLAIDSAADLVDDELLVEEISIDGMCGVY